MSTVLTSGRRNGNGSRFTAPVPSVVRCAVYTRKSTDEGLDSDFSSLDAQREACEYYIASMKAERWSLVPDRYDDGAQSGGTLDRPALKRLLADVEADRVNCVVVHRIDRLSRSLLDFGRLMELFERHGVALVSITQRLDSSSSMGRLTLNMLLSFAQFEREIIGERTRDKVRAARRRGKWTGGCLALGFDLAPGGKKLAINEAEAFMVREMYRLYLEHGSLIEVARIANENGWVTKRTPTNDGRTRGGVAWSKSSVHRVLTSPAYVARQIVEGEAYATDHPAIVDEGTWNEAQRRLEANGGDHTRGERHSSDALLAGILVCAECGSAMTPSSARKGARRYNYYRCSKQAKQGRAACPAKHVSAPVIEAQFVAEIARHATNPKLVEAVVCAARDQLAERKRSLADEARSVRRAIKDGEREIERGAADGGSAGHLDARITDLRQRASALEHERETLDATCIEPEEIAAMLAGSFDQVWGAMTSRERRKVVATIAARIVADQPTSAPTITFHHHERASILAD